MKFIQAFESLNKSDVRIAGGKGASLGEMTQAGIPVPPGFVVLSAAFERFLEETDLNVEIDAILDSVDHAVVHTIEKASENIRSLILDAEMPADIASEVTTSFSALGAEFVAVRSSATSEDSAAAAWAGQLDSFLNTTETTLLENVKKCWASLFTPRAIFYRFEKGLHGTDISVAVVVQKMIQSEVSGIAFSVHPVTEDYDQLIIEAGYGLGEAIVSGSITPDSFVVEKSDWNILDTNISVQERGLFKKEDGGNEWIDIPKEQGEKQTLTNDEVIELSKLIVKIEQHYGFPVDVEWARQDGEFYIVQSRPITTLPKSASATNILDKFEGYKFLAEGGRSTYGYPSYCIIHTYSINSHEWPLPIKGLILFKNHLAKWYFVVKNESIFDPFLESFIENPELINKLERELVFEREVFIKKISEKNLGTISISEISDLASLYYSQFEKLIRLAATLRYLDRAIMYNFRKAYPDADEYLRAISVSDEYSFVTKEEIELLNIASKCKKEKLSLKNKEALERINKVFNEYTWYSMGYYNEKPKSLQTYISILNNFINEDVDAKLKEIHTKLERELVHRKQIVSKLTEKEQKWSHVASRSTYLKDLYKYSVSKTIFHAEPMFEEITKRTGKTIDYVKDLIPEQTIKILNGSLDENEVEEMIKHNVTYMHEGEFGIITGTNAEEFESRFLETQDNSAKEFKGRVASLGHAQGIAKIIFSPKDFHKFNEGDILVAVNTSPDFVPLMRKAAAIVGEEGGLTSHTSVVSRELGVPCVVGITNITSILKDGDLVEVDANNGTVKILKN